MKKKMLALLMAAAMTATMVGCGDSNKPASNNVSSTPATSEAQPSVAESTPAETKDVSLLVWAPSEDQSAETGNWLSTTCEKFNEEHPEWNITFTYGVCAEGDAKTTITQDVEAAADVYMYANDNLTDLIANNAVAKLGGSALEYVQKNIPESLVNSVTVDGSVYGVPFTSNTWFMYYDKSVFTEDEIKNLDTMLAKAKVAFPLTNSWYIASFYAANGCTLFGDGTDANAGIDFEGAKAEAVTNYLVDLVANPNFVNDGDSAGMAGMKEGKVAALFSGSWDYGNVKEALGDNIAAAQLPNITIDGADKQMKAFAGSKAIGVNPNCDNMDVAIALAAYLGGEAAQKSHYDLRGIIPSNTAVLADAEVQKDVVVKAQGDTIANTSIMQPFVAPMGNYWTPAENFGKSLLSKEVTHENAADMTKTLNEAMNTSVVSQ